MNENNLKIYFLIGTPYLILSSTLYLFGFWSSFGINILQHIDASDIVKLSAYPMSYYTVCFMIGAAISEINNYGKATPEDGYNNKIILFLRSHLKIIGFMYPVINLLIFLLLETPYKYLIISTLIALALSVVLTHFEFTIKLLPNRNYRGLLLFLFIIMPMYAFSWGHIDSVSVLSGKSTYIVDTKTTEEKWPNEKELAYVGLYGSSYFLYSAQNKKLIITSQDVLSTLIINPNEKYKSKRK